jgi:hypothetical protein
MATAPSLFGATPESIQQARDAALDDQANAYAQLDPFQRASAGLYRGGNQLGGAIGRMLGGQDPEMQRASLLRQLGSQASPSTPEGMMTYAQALQGAGFQQEAFAASQQAQQMRLTGLDLTSKQQGVDATVASQAQTAAFRKAVTDLGPNPTQAQLLATASQFGDPKTLVASLQVSADKSESRAQQVVLAEQATAARIEAARQRGEDQKVIAQMQIDGRTQIAQLMDAFKASAKGAPKLAVGLQKAEDEDLGKINSGIAQQETFAKPLASLQPDPATGVPLLQLGPLNNQRYRLANATGRSTPASMAYEQYLAAFTEATNIKTDAAKGVQTDSDVLRQANGIITAFGKNDNATSIAALNRFNEAIDKSGERTKKIIEARRKSQGVDLYYGTPTAATTAAPKAPQYASNPATGEKIMSMDGGLTWQPRR